MWPVDDGDRTGAGQLGSRPEPPGDADAADPVCDRTLDVVVSVTPPSCTTALDTRDAEDYYHLEASSIREIDSLAFEEDADDDDTRIVSSMGN